ncbi:IclR family transcriptional regulator [Citricoccus nitrophenolicus]|uniref:IclR family transcriptional regulator n=1 Tax=Citricoccus nitrophenolicus TaxID=863575 RepID=A0ABV0IG53_9MICC|nr:IclR family transcriptional regulator [Citricoccus sp. I39-566]WMY79047.1 IclR family transcriptional regulator [Citricoccus sp. I39-566]
MRDTDRLTPSTPPILVSAERVLQVVRMVGNRGTVTVAEVARELTTSTSTAHRLLAACRAQDFVRQDVVGGAYVMGAALHELSLGATSAVQLREAAGSVLRRAAQILDETVGFVVAEGRDGRYVESVEGHRSVRITSLLGRHVPLNSFAGGRAILAALPPDEVERRLTSRILPGATPRSMTDWEDLTAELERIRARGWAVDFAEADLEAGSVAVAVIDSSGWPRGAVTVNVPLSRMTAKPEAVALARELTPFATTIQRRIRGGS